MKARHLIKEFKKYGIGPYIEVPCTILAPIISQLLKDKGCEVINPANEAVAAGLAAGSYLATQKIPVLLLQNSGLCNTLNALTSLNQIYHIPVLYIISWRGQPQTKDAPEHYVMGMKLEKLLKVLDIPHVILSENNFKEEIYRLMKIIERTKKPAALLLRAGLISTEKSIPLKSRLTMTKNRAVDIIMDISHDKAYFITTNGFISREVFYNLNKKNIEKKNPPFYMLGSMGHALPIALGVARYMEGNKKLIVLDGDGGCLMHLGSMASVAKDKNPALIHIVLDNGTHASTGGQPTLSRYIDFCKIARGCGYSNIHRFSDENKLKKEFPSLLKKTGSTFIHILINNIESKNRPRISEKYSCKQIKDRFIGQIQGGIRG